MKRWVVGITGGSGYIGSSLAGYLGKSFDVKLFEIGTLDHKFNEHIVFEKCTVTDYENVK